MVGAVRMLAMAVTLGAAAPPPVALVPKAADAVARRYALAGEVLIARGDRVLLDRAYGTVRPDGGARHRAGARWRASPSR